MTEFIIAMHLLASYKSGAMTALPTTLPVGLYEAAARRGPPPPGRSAGSPRPMEATPISRQFTGQGIQRTQSPLSRAPAGAAPPQMAQPTGSDWLISPQEKAFYDSSFAKLDTQGRGSITGEQAVMFFSNSGLGEDVLASIWDLADINSEGQLNRDEFAVAMYLIRQQRGKQVSNLPATLPPNLVPPAMRNQSRPAPQTTAPAFDNAAHASNLSKSATEDLFGLDAFSAPAPVQTQQLTGSSAADPFSSKATSPTSPQGSFQPSSRGPTSAFKPFIPSSTFGQSLTAQSTGASANTPIPQSRAAPQPSASDDLLGDNDPEVSKRLTQETTELANMSNQIGTLRNQMQEVQNKKAATDSDLQRTTTQKRDLELRLAQFRTQYEQEVKAVKDLEQRLATSREDTRKLQQELAMIEGTYHDLQNQHREVEGALQADQQENANLKERIRQVNAEIGQLRPQLDKMRSDARQQKGMAAINKKQLATNEGERDRAKGEMDHLSREAQERSLNMPVTQEPGIPGASPSLSTASQSTNPFFRRSPQPPSDNSTTPSGFTRGVSPTPAQASFDSLFGNAFAPVQANVPSQASFAHEAQMPTSSAQSGPSVLSSEPDVPTPSTSPPQSSHQESQHGLEPSAQSEFQPVAAPELPPRETPQRSESFSSSVREPAPASRYGPTDAETPTNVGPSSSITQDQDSSRDLERTEPGKTEPGKTEHSSFIAPLFHRKSTASPTASVTSDAALSGSRAGEHTDDSQGVVAPSSVPTEPIPGAFPGDVNSGLQAQSTGENNSTDRSQGTSRPKLPGSFPTGGELSRSATAVKDDFDSAFASFGDGRQSQQKAEASTSVNGESGAANMFNQEFPPIEDIGHEEESDSDSEHGFADNYTHPSPERTRGVINHNQSQPQAQSTSSTDDTYDPFKPRSTMSRTPSTGSDLPTPNAQKSPPTYDQTVPSDHTNGRGSTQFPPEFKGLLPSREDPTSPPPASQSHERSFASPVQDSQSQAPSGNSSGSTASPSAHSILPAPLASTVDTVTSTVGALPSTVSNLASSAVSNSWLSAFIHPGSTDKEQPSAAQPPHQSNSSPNDDFDSGFDDLTEAKEADDKGEDDFSFGSHQREGLDEFNPIFDSPVASKTNTIASQQTPSGNASLDNSFGDFNHYFSQGISQSKAPQQQPAANTSQDWDAIFSRLDSPQVDRPAAAGDPSKSAFPEPTSSATAVRGPWASSSGAGEMPQLARALTSGTEHDDPILKRLTGMGFSRVDALAALEKYD